jgi:hypothetical protein
MSVRLDDVENPTEALIAISALLKYSATVVESEVTKIGEAGNRELITNELQKMRNTIEKALVIAGQI